MRFPGDPVAAVAAVDEETAYEAMRRVRAEYDPLPAVFDPREALENETPPLHGYRKRQLARTSRRAAGVGSPERG